jgi:H+/Cl- antiporter ClcA
MPDFWPNNEISHPFLLECRAMPLDAADIWNKPVEAYLPKSPWRSLAHKVVPWLAAVAAGAIAVYFAQWMFKAEGWAVSFLRGYVWWAGVAMPLFFVLAAYLVRRAAPEAAGSGIPQVIWALNARSAPRALTSIRTAGVKIASALLGALGGASIGREGPTVQVSAALLSATQRLLAKFKMRTDPRALITAGGAAGVAAAFNTPLAGITFALEELASLRFTGLRQDVILTVVLAGLTAQSLAGNYAYFGHPLLSAPQAELYVYALLVGLVFGAVGALFAKALDRAPALFSDREWWAKALLAGLLCWAVSALSDGLTLGSGYAAAKGLLDGQVSSLPYWYSPAKMLTTVLSFHSGMAGGIFAPSLSIGTGLGSLSAGWFPGIPVAACGLVAMAAFFTGVVQAPLTAVVIVMEMTDQHAMILPLFLTALAAQAVAHRIMPVSLYHSIAQRMAAQAESQAPALDRGEHAPA